MSDLSYCLSSTVRRRRGGVSPRSIVAYSISVEREIGAEVFSPRCNLQCRLSRTIGSGLEEDCIRKRWRPTTTCYVFGIDTPRGRGWGTGWEGVGVRDVGGLGYGVGGWDERGRGPGRANTARDPPNYFQFPRIPGLEPRSPAEN